MASRDTEGSAPRRRVEDRQAALEREQKVVNEVIGAALGTSSRLSLNKTEAAEALGVSVEFFDEHVGPELRFVRRGRRRMYPLGELIHWLWRSSEGPDRLSHDLRGSRGGAERWMTSAAPLLTAVQGIAL